MERLTDKHCFELLQFRAAIISENLKRERRKSGLTLEEVAFLTNLGKDTILYCERGIGRTRKIFVPTINTLDRVAKVFNIPISDLIIKKHG